MIKQDVKVFTGGTILTMTADKTAEAVTVENGVIRCVGTAEECREAAERLTHDYEEINLNGQCLVPGLIDAHCHMTMRGRSLLWADISSTKVSCIDDIIKVLTDHAKDLPAGEPIRGFGFDHRSLKENRYPTAEELDRVATDRPVQIMHVSCHVNVLNHYLLNQLGITKDTPNPDGGTIGRNEAGEPNGPLFDSASDYLADEFGVEISNHGPNFHTPDTPKNLQKIIELGQNEFLAHGITTTNDVQVTKQEMNSYLAARNSGLLKVRVFCSVLSNHLNDLMNLGISSHLGDDKLAITSLKTYIDGAITAGTAYMSSAYADGMEGHGYLFHEIEEYKNIIIEGHTFGLQTLTHAQGDAGIQIVLEAIEEAQKKHPRENMRHRIEHSSFATEEQVRKMAELEVIPVPQPQNFYERGEELIGAYGKERTSNIIPYGWFKEHGVPVTITSDSPVAHVNTVQGIYAAVTRKTAKGTYMGGAEHQLTTEEALQAYTINAAKAIFKEDKIGSIEKGKYADFAVFDRNPLETDPDDLINLSITQTWIEGEQVFSKKSSEIKVG
ncbi:amidohydrolase [Bacillus piscicola]|uniref:amidohydrolase n=1 Tax=Bacillus piscicola TaxID=1632684 RepID=UPI001F09379C|nr:amidohydrolase [Bacillus piscicola]